MTGKPDLISIGAVLWDVIGRCPRPMTVGRDLPGRIVRLPGGVALNVAVAVARWGMVPAVLSAVGRDLEGEGLLTAIRALDVQTDYLCRDGGVTDIYMAIEDPDGLIAAIADAHSLEAAGDRVLDPLRDGRLASADTPWPGVAVIDGNLTTEQLGRIATEPGLRGADLRIVPASPGKAERVVPLIAAANACFYINCLEAEVLCGRKLPDAKTAAREMLAIGMARVIVTDGPHLVADGCRNDGVVTALPPAVAIARVTGAGDCFLAAHIAAERDGCSRQTALTRAAQAAAAYVSGQDMPC